MFQPYKKTKASTYFYQMWLPKILVALTITLACSLLLWGSYLVVQFAKNQQWFRFRRIHVVMQAQHLTGNQVTQLVTSHLQGGFFSLNVLALREALMAEPWVADVAFRRVWPDMLEVDVVEQKAVAQWGNARLLNDAGEIFSPPLKSFPADLPVLQGPAGSEWQVLMNYRLFQQALAPIGLRIYGLSLDPSRSWWLVVDGGLSIKLGQHHVLSRLKKFIALYPRLLQNSEKKAVTVDMRYPNGVAIQWKMAPLASS